MGEPGPTLACAAGNNNAAVVLWVVAIAISVTQSVRLIVLYQKSLLPRGRHYGKSNRALDQ